METVLMLMIGLLFSFAVYFIARAVGRSVGRREAMDYLNVRNGGQ